MDRVDPRRAQGWWPNMQGQSPAEKKLFAAPCCAGEGHTVQEGGSHINVVQLEKLAT